MEVTNTPHYSDLILQHLYKANEYITTYAKYLNKHQLSHKHEYAQLVQANIVNIIDKICNNLSTATVYRVNITASSIHRDEKFFTTQERAEEWAKEYQTAFITPPNYTIEPCTVIIEDSGTLTVIMPNFYKRITHEMLDAPYKQK